MSKGWSIIGLEKLSKSVVVLLKQNHRQFCASGIREMLIPTKILGQSRRLKSSVSLGHVMGKHIVGHHGILRSKECNNGHCSQYWFDPIMELMHNVRDSVGVFNAKTKL